MKQRPNLNQPLALEAVLRQPDGAGGYVESWQSLGTLYGALHWGAGSARLVGGAELSRNRVRITVRDTPMGAQSRPQAGQRFVSGTRVFSVQAVHEANGLPGYLSCQCHEEVAR